MRLDHRPLPGRLARPVGRRRPRLGLDPAENRGPRLRRHLAPRHLSPPARGPSLQKLSWTFLVPLALARRDRPHRRRQGGDLLAMSPFPGFPGSGLAKGLAVTLRTMTKKSVTAQYPDTQPDLAPRTRGVIGLFEENCTVCMLCARECPDWCIYIDSHKETVRRRRPAAVTAAATSSTGSPSISPCACTAVSVSRSVLSTPCSSVTRVRVRRDRHPRTHPRTRQAPRVDVDGPGPAGPRSRRRGTEGNRRRPQDSRQTVRRPARPAGRPEGGGTRYLRRSRRHGRAHHDHHRRRGSGLPLPDRCGDRLPPGRPGHLRCRRRHRHHQGAGARSPVAGGGLGGLAVEYLLLTAEFIAWVQVLLCGFGRRPAPVRVDAQSAHRPLPGRRLRQPPGRPRRGRRRGRRPGLGRRRRLPHDLDRPGRHARRLHRRDRRQPLPALGPPLRGPLRPPPRRPRRRDRPLPQGEHGRRGTGSHDTGKPPPEPPATPLGSASQPLGPASGPARASTARRRDAEGNR
ncbi:NAD(P)H-quinone oxidoreductase subunit I, chloroplastic [Streptomyces hirsutus]